MVLSIPRTWPRGNERLAAIRQQVSGRAARSTWATERGTVRWRGSADLAGGFPGCAEVGGALANVEIAITDHYLLVAEKRPEGFGLPLEVIVGVVPGEAAGARCGSLGLIYQDGALDRTFLVRVNDSLFRRDRDIGRFVGTLRRVGCDLAPWPATASLAVPWREARQFQSENVIWSGRATAPLNGGALRAAADLWLTTRSLIWAAGNGDGIHRLPLEMMREATLAQIGDQLAIPGVVLSFEDESALRHDLSFVFDRHQPPDRNGRERGAFLVGLRSRGIGPGANAPRLQPWQPTSAPDLTVLWPAPHPAASWPSPPELPATADFAESDGLPITVVSDAETARSDDGSPVTVLALSMPAPETGVAIASLAAGEEISISAPVDSADGPAVTPGIAGDEVPARPVVLDGLTPVAAPIQPEMMVNVRAYEAAAFAALAETVRLISHPGGEQPTLTPPGPTVLAAALAELEAAEASAVLADAATADRRSRLLALNEVLPRLRALLELRDRGYLSTAEVERKRAAILAPLTELLFEKGAVRGN